MEEETSIELYETEHGKCPFVDWESKLTLTTRAQIRRRLNRIRLGNFGDSKPIEGVKGIYELRIHFGPGFRIYYGKRGKRVVILLLGGDKGSQKRDISRAKKYWDDCN